ncbi:LOW QUALITY PROTEIN: coiled-coil domain-containing protein 160 [Mergus octosetaceus]
MDRKHREEFISPNCNELDFFSRANQSESLTVEKLALERAKRGGEIYNMAITRILEEKKKSFKRKEWFSKLIVQEYEPKLVGAKINISKEETDRDSACCGAGNLDVGAEESLKETEGHCAWNARELATRNAADRLGRRNLRRFNEELLQAKGETINLNPKSKDLQQDSVKLKQQHELGNKTSTEKAKTQENKERGGSRYKQTKCRKAPACLES